MIYRAKLTGEVPDPRNSMNTLKLEVSVESLNLEETANSVWRLLERTQKETTSEKTEVIFIEDKKTLPKEIMDHSSEHPYGGKMYSTWRK